jgi:carbamate kinase
MPIAVAALGGNAILGDSDATVMDLGRAPLALAELVGLGWDLVVTHADGQAVGDGPGRLEVLDAERGGALGYHLQQALGNALHELGMARVVASLLTQVVVDAGDPAFALPSKPVGPFLDPSRAEVLRARGFQMVEDPARGSRRVVPSPEPLEIVEVRAIAALLEAGVIVLAAGGGGMPVVRDARGRLRGVEAAIDEDRAASLLARLLRADLLLILSDTPELRLDSGTSRERPARRLSVDEARGQLRAGRLPHGHMGPVLEAAADFVEQTGRLALVTSAERLLDALIGTAGTLVHP